MSELINNREYRQKMLKEMIIDLHAGKSVEDVKERFKELLEHVGATEISQMEQRLIEEGMPADEIKRLCDVHTAVFKETLDTQASEEMPPGHPITAFIQENAAVTKIITEIEHIVNEITAVSVGQDISQQLRTWHDKHKKLLEIDKHFSRKENILFPYLEKNGITGPPTVMWGLHDDIRRELKKTSTILQETDKLADKYLTSQIADLVLPTLHTITELFYKEENIMFPMCLETFSPDEWQEIYDQSDEIGYTLIDPPQGWTASSEGATKQMENQGPGLIKLDTGVLTVEQLNQMLKHLPLDITFVDKENVVRYFSSGKERIFARTPAIIGRKVQFCHPPDSVHVVEKIVDDFINNRRESAEFWIQMEEKFVYIRYFPVRNETNEFLGVVEVTQDVNHIRDLKGEKRILDEE